jgi:[acyl-carrier-protein] S-malonyltransferase
MVKTACIFPGQGSQYVGMGRGLFEKDGSARATFEEADRLLGFSLSDICFSGPEERLRETRYTQPAILVHSVAVWRILEQTGFHPEYVAGHSVGEYAALVASGALVFGDALRLVKERADAMYEAGLERPGAMAALIGMPEDGLTGLIEQAGRTGILAVANHNSPVQIVISGEVEAVEAAVGVAKRFGARRAVRLNVSGAFHSPLMEPAQRRLSMSLRQTSFREAVVPVVSNVAASAVRDPVDILNLLERQLTSPVYLVDRGVSSFAEVGPGEVLCGLMKRIAPDARCFSCSDAENAAEFLTEVSV